MKATSRTTCTATVEMATQVLVRLATGMEEVTEEAMLAAMAVQATAAEAVTVEVAAELDAVVDNIKAIDKALSASAHASLLC